jgi:hypothetical protein
MDPSYCGLQEPKTNTDETGHSTDTSFASSANEHPMASDMLSTEE